MTNTVLVFFYAFMSFAVLGILEEWRIDKVASSDTHGFAASAVSLGVATVLTIVWPLTLLAAGAVAWVGVYKKTHGSAE